jgi:O-Antigen ligase
VNGATMPDLDDKAAALAETSLHKLGSGWKLAIFLLAAMPFLHALATWDWDGKITATNHHFRLYSLPVVWIEIIIICWARRLGWRPSYHLPMLGNSEKCLCVVFCFSVSITALVSNENFAVQAFFVSRYFLHIFLMSSVVFIVSKSIDFSFHYWSSIVLHGAVVYVFSLIAFCLLLTNPQNFPWVERIPSATNIRQIGNVMGILALAPATAFIFRESNKTATFTVLAFMFLMTFVMWSGTRGSLLGFGIAVSIAGWQNRKSIRSSRLLSLILLSLLALLISLIFPTPAPEFGMIRVAESFSSGDAASGRLQMWQTTIEAIRNMPFFGYGAGTFRSNMASAWSFGYPYNHPHNFVLQFVYDWGVIGGGLALMLLARFGFAILTSDQGTDEERFLSISGFVALIVMALIEGTLFHPLPIVIAITLMTPHLARCSAER